MWSNTPSRSRLAVVIAIIFIVAVIAFHNPDRLLSDERQHLNSQITASLDALKNDLDIDLQHLAYSTLFIVDQSRLHDPFGSPDDSSIFAEDFISLLNTSAFFDQLRLIDNQGMERIRANYNGGDPSLADESELQNKSSRYYFQETMKLDEHEVFLSPLDLNIENGQIQRPFKPTLRIGMPSFNYRGEREGIIMINALAEELINHFLDRSRLVPAEQISWLNGDGYWFAGEAEEKLWGFMFDDKQKITLAKQQPAIWNKVNASDQGIINTEHGTYLFTTIFPYTAFSKAKTIRLNTDRPYRWKLVAYYSDDYLNELIAEKRFDGQLIMLLSGLLLMAIFLLFGSWYRQHLLSIEAAQCESEKEQEQAHMKSIGIIAGGIAHEFNNILAALAASHYLLNKESRSESNQRLFDTVDRLTDRASKLVRYLLTFSRLGSISRTRINLSRLIKELAEESTSQLPEHYLCNTDISPDIEVSCDKEKTGSMVRELITNALDAIEGEETPQLTIALSIVEKLFDQPEKKDLHSSYAMLSIKDNGYGISPDDMPNIYDPFFTTKEVGKGVGLGLSAAIGTVKIHHGQIEVVSKVGEGTEVVVYLPTEPPLDEEQGAS